MIEKEMEITGHYVIVDKTRIYYDECGSGVPFICVHTAGACSLEYQYFLPFIAKEGFRAIAIDLPGHGKSYPVNWQPIKVMHEYAEFVWKFIQAICHEEKPVVCGSSIGGHLITDMACYHSIDMRAALSFEGGPSSCGPSSKYGKSWGSFAKDLESPHACPSWRDINERAAVSGLYQPIPMEKVTELKWHHRYTSQEIAAGDLQCWVTHNCVDKLKDIKCPFLAFKGEADYWVYEQMLDDIVKNVPNGLAEKIIGKKMGHYPMFEQPEVLANICIDFLQRRKVI